MIYHLQCGHYLCGLLGILLSRQPFRFFALDFHCKLTYAFQRLQGNQFRPAKVISSPLI